MSEEKKQPAVELTDAELDKVAGGSGGKALVYNKAGQISIDSVLMGTKYGYENFIRGYFSENGLNTTRCITGSKSSSIMQKDTCCGTE